MYLRIVIITNYPKNRKKKRMKGKGKLTISLAVHMSTPKGNLAFNVKTPP